MLILKKTPNLKVPEAIHKFYKNHNTCSRTKQTMKGKYHENLLKVSKYNSKQQHPPSPEHLMSQICCSFRRKILLKTRKLKFDADQLIRRHQDGAL